MPPAVAMGDMMKQDAPHCHAPIHPPGPVPTPTPHPGMPLAIMEGKPTVMVANKPAVTALSKSMPCMIPGCVPGGPGMVAKGSMTVKFAMMPAARINDMTAHTSCVAPIPSPVGKIMPPGQPTVMIGG
ncbi:MAG: hypothetical protein CMK59_12400 [Proteobacteria bacterium]|nr:hypothetical protein [Pseudomonadota bacterium]